MPDGEMLEVRFEIAEVYPGKLYDGIYRKIFSLRELNVYKNDCI